MKKYFITIALLVSGSLCFSNNISVSNVYIYGQNIASKFVMVNADLAWSNSWRTNVGPSNWDAAWVFIKYRLKTQTNWNHATLHYVDGTGSGDGHIASATVSSVNDTGTGGAKGVFVYASAPFAQASVAYPIQLRWDYGVDGLADADKVEICVIGIEMVYVPSSSFYVGDGTATHGQLRIQASNTPFQITSESAITLGGAVSTSLLNNNAIGMTMPDDFNNTTTQTLPATFPKGFAAFYAMKYEITQEQYAEFLNKLTRVQQAARFSSTTVGTFFASGGAPANRNGIRLMSDPGALALRIFGNDLNNNNTAGEATDGQTVACNWLSSVDLLAYLDWAGLRPMTEFEFEKSCRGTNVPLANEYAYGATVISGATGISNSGAANEVPSNVSNVVYNGAGGVPGPMRSGSFAQAATTQVQAGAGYYGMMELTGNVWEDVVLIGSNAGRTFTGLHGNGILNINGEADVNFWPGINGNSTPSNPNLAYSGTTGCTGYAGISFTGGTWNNSVWLTTSDRDYHGSGFNNINARDVRNGGRGVRTAP